MNQDLKRIVGATSGDVATRAASLLIKSLQSLLKSQETATLFLSGGKTPKLLYREFVKQKKALDWIDRKEVKNGGNVDAAKVVGKILGKRATESGIETVAFDRSGFKYHGRIAAFADAAREAGLKF